MKLIGLSPARIFSGFETSFFNAIRGQGASIDAVEVEVPWFKLWCTLTSFYPSRKVWGTRRDRHYHTTIGAFKRKSAAARKAVMAHQSGADAIYQVGALWNPLGDGVKIPLVLQVDYTSLLSKKRGSEWRRRDGKEQDFWVEQEKKLYKQAAVVLTTTENARRSIIEDYGIAEDHVVRVGAGVSPPYDELDENREPEYASKRVFFVGKGFYGKGLDTILEAFPRVREEVPDARLTIVGPTGLTVEQEGVEYLGRIADRRQVREMYYEHALFVMPSRFEPLGQVFLEAMSCHVPCIGSTLDAMPELIDHGSTGYLIEAGDAEALARYMIEAIGSPEHARSLGQAGFEKLKQNYTWPVVASKIVTEITNRIG